MKNSSFYAEQYYASSLLNDVVWKGRGGTMKIAWWQTNRNDSGPGVHGCDPDGLLCIAFWDNGWFWTSPDKLWTSRDEFSVLIALRSKHMGIATCWGRLWAILIRLQARHALKSRLVQTETQKVRFCSRLLRSQPACMLVQVLYSKIPDLLLVE